MADNDDLSRIEVELSLMSGRETAAAEDLSKSLQTIAESFKALAISDPGEQARKFKQAMENDAERSKQIQANARTQGGPSEGGPKDVNTGVADVDQLNAARRVQEAQQQEILAKYGLAQPPPTGATDADSVREVVERERQEKERKKLEENRQAEEEIGREVRAKLGVRDRLFQQPNHPTQEMQELDKESDFIGHSGQFTIPRFGNLNLQDYFNAGRIVNMRRAQTEREAMSQQAFESGDPAGLSPEEIDQMTPAKRDEYYSNFSNATTATADTKAGYWNFGAQAAGIHNAVRSVYQQGREMLARNDLDPGQMVARGASLGLDASGDNITIPGTDIGIRTPFSEAGREGFRQSLDTIKNRFRPGIGQKESEAITSASVETGLRGDQAQEWRDDLLVPLAQQYNVDPNTITPFSQVLRTNTGNIRQLSSVLNGLGASAKATNLLTKDLTEGLYAAGEAAQQSGGSMIKGMQFGQRFNDTTGLPAQVGVDMLQNGIVQGTLAARSGAPPMAQGALPAGQKIDAIQHSLRMVYNQMAPAFRGGTNYEVRDPDTGELITKQHTSGKDLAIGATASYFHQSRDAVKQMLTRTGVYAVNDADTIVDDWSNRVEHWKKGHASEGGVFKDPVVEQRRKDYIESSIRQAEQQGHEVTPGERQALEKRAEILNPFQRTTKVNKDEEAWKHFETNTGSNVGRADWSDVKKSVERVWGWDPEGHGDRNNKRKAEADKKIEDIRKQALHDHKSSDWVRQQVREVVTKKVADQNSPTLKVKFTGKAKQYFEGEIERSKNGTDGLDWLRNNEPANKSASTAAGPDPTSADPGANFRYSNDNSGGGDNMGSGSAYGAMSPGQ